MAIKDMSDGGDPVVDDDRIENGLLYTLAHEHPSAFTDDEIALQMIANPPGGFGERESIDRAIRSLIADGLARRDGEYVRLTRAGIRAHHLLDL